jgi:hypothetical protein
MADTTFADEYALASAGLAPPGLTSGLQVPPAGFGWDFARFPVNVYRNGPRDYSTDFDPTSLMPSGFWNLPVYYVDRSKPDNNGAGTSRSTAKRSIWAAMAQAGTTGGIVLVRGDVGFYDRNNDFNFTGATKVDPLGPIAVIGYGGEVETGPRALLSWAADTTFTSCYTAVRSSVGKVLNLLERDSSGFYAEIPVAADATTLNSTATEAGWFQNGANVLVKRRDGKPVTDANTCVLLADVAIRTAPFSTFLSGIRAMGGLVGTLDARATFSGNLAVQDCSFSFPSNIQGRAISVDNMDGMSAFFRTTAGRAATDGFNGHKANGGLHHMLTVDCVSDFVGDAAVPGSNNVSSQPYTLHEAVKGIDLGGNWRRGRGGIITNINDSELWSLGSVLQNDRGDTDISGGYDSAGAIIRDNSKAWFQEVESRGNMRSFVNFGANSQVNTRACRDGGSPRVGVVKSF